MWDPFAEFQSFTLPNGLRCHVATWDRPWICIGAVVYAGSVHDPCGKEGTAHFVEHLLSENVHGMSFAELRAECDRRSIIANFGSTTECANLICFRVPLFGDNVERACVVLGHMLFDATFDRHVERERRVVLEEASERLSFPVERRWRMERGRMFWGVRHRLVRFFGPCGIPSTIRAICVDDLRDWYARYYTPCNVDVVVCGGLSLDAVRDCIVNSPLAASRSGVPSVASSPAMVRSYRSRRRCLRFSDHIRAALDHGRIEIIVPYPRVPLAVPAIARACESINEALFQCVRERVGGDYDISVSALEHPEGFELMLLGNFPKELVSVIERHVDDALIFAEDEELIARFVARAVFEWTLVDMSGREIFDAALSSLADERRIVTVMEHLACARTLTVPDVQAVIRAFAPERRWTLLCVP